MPGERDSATDRIRAARADYRPKEVKCVLIAEAPPDSLDRFFYYPDVRTADYLFLGVMEALYPSEKDDYLAFGRATEQKEALLRRFQDDGYYLLGILDEPIISEQQLERGMPRLIKQLGSMAKPETPIILIKTSTCDVAADKLRRAGFNVIRARIPFPGQGWQIMFQEKFRQALRLAGISVSEA